MSSRAGQTSAILSFPAPDVFSVNDLRYRVGGEASCHRGRLRLTREYGGTDYFGSYRRYRSVWLARTNAALVVELEDVEWFFLLWVVPTRSRTIEWYRYPVAPA